MCINIYKFFHDFQDYHKEGAHLKRIMTYLVLISALRCFSNSDKIARLVQSMQINLGFYVSSLNPELARPVLRIAFLQFKDAFNFCLQERNKIDAQKLFDEFNIFRTDLNSDDFNEFDNLEKSLKGLK